MYAGVYQQEIPQYQTFVLLNMISIFIYCM